MEAYGCGCRWIADVGQVEECATHRALREENARLEKLNASWEYEVEQCRVERDEARAEEKSWRRIARLRTAELDTAQRESSRLEGRILDWGEHSISRHLPGLADEARRIRAQREESDRRLRQEVDR